VKIFVSSTYTDLTQHRRVLLDALHQLSPEISVYAMEYFGASSTDAIDVSRRKVLECDLYVGILGWRYGSVDRRTQMSITEVEYRSALAKRIPTLLYLTSESAPVLPAAVDTGSPAKMIRRLRAEVKDRHLVQMFTTPEDLARRVTVDLVPFLGKRERGDGRSTIPAGPVGRDVNPAFPFLLCHLVGRRFGEHHQVTIYLDLHEENPALHASILQSVDRVVYQLHESFVVPVVPMQNWREHFELSLRAWGEFWIQATVHFSDASRRPVTLLRYVNLPGLPDPIVDAQKKPA
jgi:hypothetical protein